MHLFSYSSGSQKSDEFYRTKIKMLARTISLLDIPGVNPFTAQLLGVADIPLLMAAYIFKVSRAASSPTF